MLSVGEKMIHSTKPFSNDKREIVVQMKKAGMSETKIKELTGVSSRSQRRYVKLDQEGSVMIKKPDRTGSNNSRGKVTEEYLTALRVLVAEKCDLFDDELVDELHEQTGIRITSSHMVKIRKKIGISRKLKSIHYPERTLPENIKLAKQFRENHCRINSPISLQHCSSTDECGFKSDIQRRYGKSQIKITREYKKDRPPIRKSSGGSYYKSESKVYGVAQKHAAWKINLIATICLDPDNPVPGFEFSDEYVNGVIFSHYVDGLDWSSIVTHDLMDKASFHVSRKGNEKKGKIAVPDIYENKDIEMDFVPRGYPEFNPIEQLFGWLKQYLKKQAISYHSGEGWTKEVMKQVLCEAKDLVTHELVKSWYRNSFQHMHPGQLIPNYLQSTKE